MFIPDGSQETDVNRCISMAQQRHEKILHIWKSGHLHLRLYVTAVYSVMAYGSEDWILDNKTKKRLNGVNSKMVNFITGHTIHEEGNQEGKTYDIIASIRSRRLKWIGQILIMDEDRLLPVAPNGQMFRRGALGYNTQRAPTKT